MSMINWARNEVELACAGLGQDEESEYIRACYRSAFNAYKCLMDDGHSGASFGVTKSILIQLLNEQTLSPIENSDAIWVEAGQTEDKRMYQCSRRYSLFKDVDKDGNESFHDNDLCYCVNSDGIPHHSGLVSNLIHEMFPISFPYCPSKPIRVECEEFLTDVRNGDFDTVGVLCATKPDGSKVNINRYFKEDKNTKKFVEILYTEYMMRRDRSIH